MKKILIISSSPRKNGNSDILCDEFARGASAAGHAVEKIRLAEKKINYCNGCGTCNAKKQCVQTDDIPELAAKMTAADVIVLATPVYFYTMCGQLKTFIDRMCPYYESIAGKEFYFIATMADGDRAAMERTFEGLRGFTACLPAASECGVLCAPGVWQKGEVGRSPALAEAYDMGKKV